VKDISVALKAHLALGSTTMALCWKATLTNGTVVTATAHDRDIEYPVDSGVIYLSTAAYTPSDVESGSDMAPDNLEVEGFLASPHITAADVHSGIWDYAAIDIFEVNYRDLTMGTNPIRIGATLGEVKAGLAMFRAELRGLMQRYSRRIVRLIQATCDADLGDARCGVDLAPFTVNATVEAVSENRVITCESLREPLNWYSGGKITFTSGDNSALGDAGADLSMEVKRSAGAQITLHEMMPFTIVVGDTFSVYAGCQKRKAEDCIPKFNNVVNFRGFDLLPGSRVYAGPNAGLEAPTAAPAPSAPVPAPPPPAEPPAPAPGPAPAPSPAAPTITVAAWPNTILQTGNDDEAYWMQDNRWGQGSIVEGSAVDQFEQQIGVSSTIGANGEVAFRMKWRWPDPVGSNEVKGYPAILYGRKPGIYNTGPTPGGLTVRLLDGTNSLTAPSGPTPGTFLPQQLPLAGLKAYANFANVSAAPTGEGHLSYDIWLQSSSTQDHGFTASSITHEIMIPLTYWGGYGAYPSGRNPDWYSHDVTIGGILFHVYCSMNGAGVLSYNFGSLDGTYGRTGWKFIVFEPDATDIPITGEIDIAAIIAHAASRVDSAATPWLAGTEWVSSIELGVEPNEGAGDIVVYDFRVYT
jgi:uncharacterized phage protein (TIGR02218 family)